jgi:hypothetical protein
MRGSFKLLCCIVVFAVFVSSVRHTHRSPRAALSKQHSLRQHPSLMQALSDML